MNIQKWIINWNKKNGESAKTIIKINKLKKQHITTWQHNNTITRGEGEGEGRG